MNQKKKMNISIIWFSGSFDRVEFFRVKLENVRNFRLAGYHFFKNLAHDQEPFILRFASPTRNKTILWSGGKNSFIIVDNQCFLNVSSQSIEIFCENAIILNKLKYTIMQ